MTTHTHAGTWLGRAGTSYWIGDDEFSVTAKVWDDAPGEAIIRVLRGAYANAVVLNERTVPVAEMEIVMANEYELYSA